MTRDLLLPDSMILFDLKAPRSVRAPSIVLCIRYVSLNVLSSKLVMFCRAFSKFKRKQNGFALLMFRSWTTRLQQPHHPQHLPSFTIRQMFLFTFVDLHQAPINSSTIDEKALPRFILHPRSVAIASHKLPSLFVSESPR